MTGMKPMFQFSSFDDKTYIGKLSEAIRRLGGLYDESKVRYLIEIVKKSYPIYLEID